MVAPTPNHSLGWLIPLACLAAFLSLSVRAATSAQDTSVAVPDPAVSPVANAEPPTRWWINANGRTGWLNYTVDPVSHRVEGVLLGKPVTGFLLERRLILYGEHEGSYFWEGWIMRPESVPPNPLYRSDYFIAGTFQQIGDVIFPWYGLTAGSALPGGPAADLAATENDSQSLGLNHSLNDFFVIRREGVSSLLIVKGKKSLLENDEVVAGPLSYPDARRRIKEYRPPETPHRP
ncbi:MAG: hypothetical protein JXQ27_06160 [Acidobacteria bacterium]|nr:hypothetical protein [Acidobacteriota bacterium]